MTKRDVHFDTLSNTLFVYEGNITYVIELNNGTFKRVPKNKIALQCEEKTIRGLLNCKKVIENLKNSINKISKEAENIKFDAILLDEKIKEFLDEHPELKMINNE